MEIAFKNKVDSFRDFRIGVIGDLMLDRYVCGKATRISPEAPVPIVLVDNQKCVPGGAANVANNVVSLNAKASLFGFVGNDEYGHVICGILEESGVDTSGVVVASDCITTVKTRIVADSQQIVRVDAEFPSQIDDNLRSELFGRISEAINGDSIDMIIIEDYAKGVFTKEFMSEIVSLANKKGIPIAIDPHPSHPYDICGFSFMTPNRSEAFALSGVKYSASSYHPSEDKELIEVGRILLEKWNPEIVLITLGSDGMALFSKHNAIPKVIPTFAKQVFDVSGAGDTVMATMALSLCSGLDCYDSAYVANKAAGIVVGYSGTHPIDSEELKKSL